MKKRPSLRHGLPYGWWRGYPWERTATTILLLITLATMIGLGAAWAGVWG